MENGAKKQQTASREHNKQAGTVPGAGGVIFTPHFNCSHQSLVNVLTAAKYVRIDTQIFFASKRNEVKRDSFRFHFGFLSENFTSIFPLIFTFQIFLFASVFFFSLHIFLYALFFVYLFFRFASVFCSFASKQYFFSFSLCFFRFAFFVTFRFNSFLLRM